MNTHETYVSLEVAKLLKQVGFDWKVNARWLSLNGLKNKEAEHIRDMLPMDDFELVTDVLCENQNVGNTSYLYSAPTLSVAQKWLREVKRIFITVSVYAVIEQGHEITDSDKFSVYAETWNSQSKFWNKWTSIFEINDFNTYEEAQEVGIKKALEIILEKG